MSGSPTGIEVLRAASAGEFPLPPAAMLLGWEPLEIEPGRVLVKYAARQEFYNPQGNVQGGLLAAMLDDAMGPALFTLLDGGQFAPTLELKVNYIRPARAGTLIAEGRVVHRGGSVAFMEGSLSTEGGELVATATATARIVAAPSAEANGNGYQR